MKLKEENNYIENVEYLCKKNNIKFKDLRLKLSIKRSLWTIDSFIKICNYFDMAADDILFQTLIKDNK